MKIFSGTIITCDGNDRICRYLVEDRGIIRYTGDTLPEKFATHPRIELGTRALVPAFADTHLHFSSFALFHNGLNVTDARSNGEILELLRKERHRPSDEVVIGFGLSPHCVEEGRMVTREELDSAIPFHPVFMVKYDGHACIVNSEFLKRLPDRVAGMRGYDAVSGELRQEAFFAATDFVTGSVSPVELIRNMIRAYDTMADRGFGLIHTVSGIGFPRDLDVDLERWVARGIRRGVRTRLFFQTMDIEKVRRRRLRRIGGCFATALDGCFGSMDAALHRPYEGSERRGILFYTDEEVTAFCKKANRENLQIELHAIGDAAFDQAARALDEALKDHPRQDHRHGIIHACLPTDRGLDLCAERGIQIPLQPAFLDWPQEPSSYLRQILGDREARLNPLRTMADRGILLSGGSDAPCTEPDPVFGIHCACNHPVPEESLTVQEALKLFTINGCRASFDEKTGGSLEEGKQADMVLLSDNPLTIPKEELKLLRVEKTFLGGRSSGHPVRGAVPTLLRGMLSSRPL